MSQIDIANEMLTRIDSKYDKTIGSFAYDAVATVGVELNGHTKKIESEFKKRFVATATGKDLDDAVAELGIERKNASYSTGKVTIEGAPGSNIRKGDFVASDTVNFQFDENSIVPDSGIIEVKSICTILGKLGNVPKGAIKYFPKTLDGLTTVTNKEAFTNGYDEEEDESLRERYYLKARNPGKSGNENDYKIWATEVTGCRNAKAHECTNEHGEKQKGHVLVVIVNSNNRAADSTLITNVYNHIEEERPVGATVHVISALEVQINITGTIIIDNAHVLNDIQNEFKSLIEKYLNSISFTGTTISIAKIGSLLINIEGVEDYSNLKINNQTSNIILAVNEIPVLDNIELGV